MKKVIDYLKGLYIRDGKPARKVLFGTLGFVVAVVIAFTNGNTDNIYAFLIFSISCFGFVTVDKFVKKENE